MFAGWWNKSHSFIQCKMMSWGYFYPVPSRTTTWHTVEEFKAHWRCYSQQTNSHWLIKLSLADQFRKMHNTAKLFRNAHSTLKQLKKNPCKEIKARGVCGQKKITSARSDASAGAEYRTNSNERESTTDSISNEFYDEGEKAKKPEQ